MPTRRLVLSGLAASLAAPALAQADPWAGALEAARALPQLRSILIAKDGEEVVAEAVRGPGLDRPANVKSVSKSIVALVLGGAVDRGVVPGVGATLGEVAPRLIPDGADPRVAGITLEDLVTLRAGLERTSGGNYGEWVSSGNWVANQLSRPFVAEPGGRMLYSTGSFHVLGAALAEASGESLLALARGWLGEPLGIEVAPWTRDPQGFYLGGNEMALSPRAMLRVGEMVRQRGTWDGTRVLSEDWIEASLRPVTRSPFSGLDYGRGWFLGDAPRGRVAIARGYGGQVIAVAPGVGVTCVVTSDPNQPARSEGYFGDLMALLGREVLARA
ncbi:serine hydrolase domain-containing protein [Rubellimicrobium aerolatum]|uniref:Serine hydrolase domain-containing protein n=1 Tax=Rubellimicrobium aerolatum TaxID=490979 RepID=A0ABW0SFL6_9RHOB|nr:serine hydrolase [Rubellimicrobium aerolatum]MBP1807077.1 CubicO group peptidase (beta-lactamase class C family) [Rubellimicrobium aerolatum]